MTGPPAAPVVPSRPLGTSTASTGTRASRMRLANSAAVPVERARQAGAEQGVDDEVRALDRVRRIQRLAPVRPAPRHLAASPLSASRRPEEVEAARRSRAASGGGRRRSRRRHCCRDRTARRRGPGCRPGCGHVGDGAAGVLHQRRGSARRASRPGCRRATSLRPSEARGPATVDSSVISAVIPQPDHRRRAPAQKASMLVGHLPFISELLCI